MILQLISEVAYEQDLPETGVSVRAGRDDLRSFRHFHGDHGIRTRDGGHDFSIRSKRGVQGSVLVHADDRRIAVGFTEGDDASGSPHGDGATNVRASQIDSAISLR